MTSVAAARAPSRDATLRRLRRVSALNIGILVAAVVAAVVILVVTGNLGFLIVMLASSVGRRRGIGCGPVSNLYIAVSDPGSADAISILRAYFEDIVGRYHGRTASQSEVDAAMRDEPSDDLHGATGVLVIAEQDGVPVACGGIRFIGSGVGELTRIFVSPAARGLGAGGKIIRHLEALALEARLVQIRLDVRPDLTEAQRLYVRQGYQEVEPFNNARYAGHWFSKSLGAPPLG